MHTLLLACAVATAEKEGVDWADPAGDSAADSGQRDSAEEPYVDEDCDTAIPIEEGPCGVEESEIEDRIVGVEDGAYVGFPMAGSDDGRLYLASQVMDRGGEVWEWVGAVEGTQPITGARSVVSGPVAGEFFGRRLAVWGDGFAAADEDTVQTFDAGAHAATLFLVPDGGSCCVDRVTTGNLDGDGLDDLVVRMTFADEGNADLVVPGTLTGFVSFRDIESRLDCASSDQGAIVGDTDGDGLDDIAVTESPGWFAAMLFRAPHDGERTEVAADAWYEGGLYAEIQPAGDGDGDGLADLLMIVSDKGLSYPRLVLHAGRFEGVVTLDQSLATALSTDDWGRDRFGMTWALPNDFLGEFDLDGDGWPESAVQVGLSGPMALWILPGPLEGTIVFDPWSHLHMDSLNPSPLTFAATDLNQDGADELAVSLDDSFGEVLIVGWDSLHPE